MATGTTLTTGMLWMVLLLFCLIVPPAHADVSCPIEHEGRSSSSCLGGQCVNATVFSQPCEPPRWWPPFMNWMWCGGTSAGEDGDGTTAAVPRCANECDSDGGCSDNEVCTTDPEDGYSGSGFGLCIAAPIDDDDDVIVVDPPLNADACSSDETWVPNPIPQHSGGRCQPTSELIECCYLVDPLSACQQGVPTDCPDNGLCANTGYCYERNSINPGLLEPGLNRDPDVFPPPPSEVRPQGRITD